MGRGSPKALEPVPVGRQINLYRKKLGLSMQQLGQKVGVTDSYIAYLETGKRKASRKIINQLVNFFFPNGNQVLLDEWLMQCGFSPTRLPCYSPPRNPLIFYEEKLSKDEGDFKTQITYIRSLIKAGMRDRAKTQIQKCFQIFEDSIQVHALVGTLELTKKNYAAAIQSQKTALEFYRSRSSEVAEQSMSLVDLYLSLGVSHFLYGYEHLKNLENDLAIQNFKTARTQFKKALKCAPDDLYVWDEYARVSFNLADLSTSETGLSYWGDTIDGFERVLKDKGNDILGEQALMEAAVFLGHAHTKCQQFDEAEKILGLIQSIRPDSWLVHYVKACFYSLKYDHTQSDSLLDDSLDALNLAVEVEDPDNQARDEAKHDPDLKSLRELRLDKFKKIVPVAEGKKTP